MACVVIDLYTWTTPNGRKVSIMLEEVGLPYDVHPVDIGKEQQYTPSFQKLSPNNKIPAIYDREEDFSLMESGAILIYLAEKTGQLLPTGKFERLRVIEWLMFQMGGIGPMLGQAHHFVHFNPGKSAYALERYANEAKRLYKVMNRRLEQSAYLGGDEYSIADVAAWPWISRFEWQGVTIDDYPDVCRWYTAIAARPAVARGYDVPRKVNPIPMPRSYTNP